MIRPGPQKAGTKYISSEIKKALQSKDDTKDTAVSASVLGKRAARDTVCAVRTTSRFVGKTVRLTRHAVKNRGKLLTKSNGKKVLKATGRATAKGAVELGKQTKEGIVNSLYTSDTSDTGMGSLNLAYRSKRVKKEASELVKSTVRGGRKVYQYYGTHRRDQITRNKIKEEIFKKGGRQPPRQRQKIFRRRTSSTAGKMRGAASLRNRATTLKNGAAAAGKALRFLVTKIPLPVLLGAVGGVLLLLMISSASSGVMGALPFHFPMAEESTMEKYADAIEQLDKDLENTVKAYKKKPQYDSVLIEYMGEIGEVKTNWQEIVSILSVEFEQDISFSPAEQARMREIYKKMRYITTREEKYYCNAKNCKGHKRLFVCVHSYDLEDIIDQLNFDEDQKAWCRQLAASNWGELYPHLSFAGETLSQEEIADLIKKAPTSNATRKEIRETALSLVGKIPYFWGGKSAAGWNDKWGTSVVVSAPGSSTTGTPQPYGLDCSGFVDWVYKTSGAGNLLSGGGSSYQWQKSYTVPENELQPGDLVFQSIPGSSGKNHVGIFVGKKNGKNLYCHCAYGSGVVMNSYSGFKFFRRPFLDFGD
ncbi:MAG: NlpC/P60 family protein [Eubacteriales bacterium]|nr:NlpC/P60 family protein [Eubacteriales bacterium]MDD3350008.1 NlpC/P60 family protein [Eubacteriales bacterium]